jgi:hypothetical protein
MAVNSDCIKFGPALPYRLPGLSQETWTISLFRVVEEQRRVALKTGGRPTWHGDIQPLVSLGHGKELKAENLTVMDVESLNSIWHVLNKRKPLPGVGDHQADG